MELFQKFGFEPVFFIAQIINFLILAFVFKKYLYKPVLKILKDREQKITKGLKDAEDARLALEEASKKKGDIIRSAMLEAGKIIDDTKTNVQKLREELMAQSRADAERLIMEARKQADFEMKRMESQAKDIALDLSKKLLERILDELFTKQEKEIILQRNIRKLSKYE